MAVDRVVYASMASRFQALEEYDTGTNVTLDFEANPLAISVLLSCIEDVTV